MNQPLHVRQKGGLPPWHLWGNSQSITSITNGPPQFDSATQQLVRIDYGRPETWTFVFSALLTASAQNVASVIIVSFDLTIGVGRSTVSIPNFEQYQFANTDVGKQIFSTTVSAPKRTPTDAAGNIISAFSAESIQCVARVVATANLSTQATVQVSAMFSPRAHVRPEWYSQHFPGGEDNGR